MNKYLAIISFDCTFYLINIQKLIYKISLLNILKSYIYQYLSPYLIILIKTYRWLSDSLYLDFSYK